MARSAGSFGVSVGGLEFEGSGWKVAGFKLKVSYVDGRGGVSEEVRWEVGLCLYSNIFKI